MNAEMHPYRKVFREGEEEYKEGGGDEVRGDLLTIGPRRWRAVVNRENSRGVVKEPKANTGLKHQIKKNVLITI